MNKKLVSLVVAITCVVGIAVAVPSAHEGRHGDKHKDCDKRQSYDKHRGDNRQDCDKDKSSCSKKRCILKQRKECVCFYLKKADELGLSEEQIAELKKLQREAKTVKIRSKAEVKIIKLEIDALLDEKDPDQSAIEEKIDKISKLMATKKKACFAASLKARKVLTEEQFKLSKKLGKECPLSKGEDKK